MRLNLDNVSIYELFVRDNLLGDGISNINTAFLIRPSVIIEENMLSLIVGLIDQEKFGDFTMLIIFVPVEIIFLDGHGRFFLEGLSNVHVLRNWVANFSAIFILLIIIKSIIKCVRIIGESGHQTCDELGI